MLKISEGAANMEEEQPVQSHKQGNIEKTIIKEKNLTWKIYFINFICSLFVFWRAKEKDEAETTKSVQSSRQKRHFTTETTWKGAKRGWCE